MNTYKNSLTYVLFLMSFIPMFSLKFLGEPSSADELLIRIYNLYKYIFGPCLLLMVIILNIELNKIQLGLLLIGIVLFMTTLYSNNFSILNIFFILLSIKNIKISNIMIISLLLGGGLSLIIIGDFILDMYYGSNSYYVIDSKDVIRYTFGYDNPNSFPMRMFGLLCIYCILRKKMNFLDFIFWLSILFFIYEYTKSRTSFIVGGGLLISVYFYHKYNYLNLYGVSFLYRHAFLIFLLLSLSSVYLYSNEYFFMNEINKFLSGRISMGYIVLSGVGISIFGVDIEKFLIENRIVLDNLYLYIILCTGILFTVVSVISSYQLFKLLSKHKLYKEIIVLVFVLIYSLSEKTFLDIYLNLSLLLFSFLIYNNKILGYKYEKFY